MGGNSDLVRDKLMKELKNICNEWSFAALKSNGSVVTWGDAGHGGDSQSVGEELNENVVSLVDGSCICSLEEQWLCHHLGDQQSGGGSSVSNDLGLA